jgi:phospholipid/cholesterol/gamma-HCH transport system ATP-binding protein
VPIRSYLEFDHVYLELSNRRFFNDFSFQVDAGERWLVFGPYGCGKSLIARTALGLVPIDAGRLHVLDREVTNMHHDELLHLRRRIGFVPRDNHLIRNSSVRENLALPLNYQDDVSSRDVRQRMQSLFEFLNLDYWADMRPLALPPLVQKKVALGQAIARLPDILLIDGLRSRMDPVMREHMNLLVYESFPRWWKQQRGLDDTAAGPVIVELTTTLQGIREYVDHAAMLHNGKFVFQGELAELQTTDNPYVKQFRTGALEGPITYRDEGFA